MKKRWLLPVVVSPRDCSQDHDHNRHYQWKEWAEHHGYYFCVIVIVPYHHRRERHHVCFKPFFWYFLHSWRDEISQPHVKENLKSFYCTAEPALISWQISKIWRRTTEDAVRICVVISDVFVLQPQTQRDLSCCQLTFSKGASFWWDYIIWEHGNLTYSQVSLY